MSEESAIRAILKRYRVRPDNLARIRTGKPIYSVFTGLKGNVRKVSKPLSYADAHEEQQKLTVRDLLEFMGKDTFQCLTQHT